MTQVDDARGLCERLVEGIAESEIDHPGSPLGALTLSCGVSGVAAGNRRLLNWRQVFDEADNALYRVKRGGRNGVAAFRNWSNKKLDASRLAPPGFQRGYRAARASRR
jgi:PleD family two-component response regulator